MEGLLIDEVIREIAPLLPSERMSWRFPDPYTFVLPLNSDHALWFYNRPPHPRIAIEKQFPAVKSSTTGFQDLLEAKVGGTITGISQYKLDRTLTLEFAGEEGFVATEPVKLVFELTGRNCNIILTDSNDKILGAAKEIHKDINRFRQIRSGLTYSPPPPYIKLDPRTASTEDFKTVLENTTLKDVRSNIDGIGPHLAKTLALIAGISPTKELDTEALDKVIIAIKKLVAEPTKTMQEALAMPDIDSLRHQEALDGKRSKINESLKKRKDLAQKRLADIAKARKAAASADKIRNEADVLMAYQYQVEKGATHAILPDFEGNDIKIQLDPLLSPTQNAEALYARAKKRVRRADQASLLEEEIQAELKEVSDVLDSLNDASLKQLDTLSKKYVKESKAQFKAEPYIEYTDPIGYTVLVGRNAKGNDHLTFKVAKSQDIWLHAQGYPGSHVIIKAQKKQVPFETILYASQLAAAYSKAAQSDNVPVDYTLKKNVWKLKGMPPGAVHMSQQKTVFVTPSRSPK